MFLHIHAKNTLISLMVAVKEVKVLLGSGMRW